MLGKVGLVAAVAFLFVLAVIPAALAGVIYPGQEQARLDMAMGRSYCAALVETGVYDHSHGTVTLIDDGNWVLGAWHVIEDGYSALSVMFGESVYDAPTEIIPIDMDEVHRIAGHDAFVARLEWEPTTATPIQRLRETIEIGDEGYFSGYGALYYPDQGFVTEDGQRRTGVFEVDGNWSGTQVYSKFYPPGHPLLDLDDMGSAPGDSGGTIEFLDSLGQPAIGALDFGATGLGYNWTVALRLDVINAQIDAVVPEPASGVLMLAAAVSFVRVRRRSA